MPSVVVPAKSRLLARGEREGENGPMLRIQLTLALLVFACCGCTGFRGNMLPQLDRNELTPENRLPAISYQCNPLGGQSAPVVNASWPAASNEWLFRSAFLDARPGPAADDLHIDLFLQTEMRQPSFTIGLAVLTVCTLGLIPTYGLEDVSLRARLEYQGKLVRTYSYTDTMELWVHLVMIPWSFSHDVVAVERSIYDNLLLHLLRELRKDIPQIVSAVQP